MTTIGTENFDLTPEEHLARAHELIDPMPVAGDMIRRVEERQVIGGRHAALALLKMADAAEAGPPVVEVTMPEDAEDEFKRWIRAQVQAQKTKPTIEAAAEAVQATRQRLANLLTERCPGPHRFVQHRDHRLPWCNACRYTPDGQPVPPREPGKGTPA